MAFLTPYVLQLLQAKSQFTPPHARLFFKAYVQVTRLVAAVGIAAARDAGDTPFLMEETERPEEAPVLDLIKMRVATHLVLAESL